MHRKPKKYIFQQNMKFRGIFSKCYSMVFIEVFAHLLASGSFNQFSFEDGKICNENRTLQGAFDL